ncbi:HAD family hydrolase [Gilvimarinus polysaccharolyticus]|uniref:HAD family hydrolase n=1 Tax=Gilvimarinus polysaccharolyticus TaxID=863921 RepID=UPI0006734254|nr:HAD-IB family hydrolase [Gilvimarinus polysaccharolyticus]
MSNIKPLTAEHCYAFFDVDNTLITQNSMLSFQNYWYQMYPDLAAESLYRADLMTHVHEHACWETLNKLYYRHFSGRSVAALTDAGESWFKQQLQRSDGFYYQAVLRELRRHQENGFEVIMVSGSFSAVLTPIARDLGVEKILSSQMEVRAGVYTGYLSAPPMVGAGKRDAVKALLCNTRVAQSSYAYGDDISDIPMLSLVGYPVMVSGGRLSRTEVDKLGFRLITV